VQSTTYTPLELKVCTLLAALTTVYHPYTVVVNKKKESLVENIIKDSLKLSNKEAVFSERVSKAVAELEKLITNFKKNDQ
jgi:hypothetical protein